METPDIAPAVPDKITLNREEWKLFTFGYSALLTEVSIVLLERGLLVWDPQSLRFHVMR